MASQCIRSVHSRPASAGRCRTKSQDPRRPVAIAKTVGGSTPGFRTGMGWKRPVRQERAWILPTCDEWQELAGCGHWLIRKYESSIVSKREPGALLASPLLASLSRPSRPLSQSVSPNRPPLTSPTPTVVEPATLTPPSLLRHTGCSIGS